MTTRWRGKDIENIANASASEAPLIVAEDVRPLIPHLDLWDMWPLQERDGRIADLGGGRALWMVLSAPRRDDPMMRHFEARIRLFEQRDGRWRDLGDLLPNGFGPGNREWAGSAVRDGDRVTLHYTAAGVAGATGGYRQRLFQTTGTLDADGRIGAWTAPIETVASDGRFYAHADQSEGEPGRIRAFRDPSHFRDPASGRDYLFFTASLADSRSPFCGVVGVAAADRDGAWTLLPPLVHADGLNNELERPHVVVRDGLYYLFWSTQRSVFAPEGPSGPNGLYGMVAAALEGPWRPLNGSGLVIANPAAEPFQAYSWWVLDDLQVVSFVDHWGLQGRGLASRPGLARASFGGTPAPVLAIALSGETAVLRDTRRRAA